MKNHRLCSFICIVLTLAGVLWWRAGAVTQTAREAQQTSRPQTAANLRTARSREVVPEVGLTSRAKTMLASNGFVVVTEKYPAKEVADFYWRCKYDKQPILATSDSMLHMSHLVFDWYLRFLETAHLSSDLANLTDSGIAMSMSYWDSARDRNLKDAALANARYFYVTKTLLGKAKLDEVPQPMKGKIEAEVKLIEAHRGFAESPLFRYREDYSQYKPRGHYSRSKVLSNYFKAMMWYGRMTFRTRSRNETSRALLICKALEEGKAKGEQALRVWKRIEGITAFFAGEADDLTPEEYLPLARKVFGAGLPLSRLADANKVDAFRSQAAKLRKPGVLSGFWAATGPGSWESGTQGFRLIGQRFSLDGHIMQQLVFNKVGKWQGRGAKPFTLTNAQGLLVRGFPRGLDVLAAMGSDTAKSVVEQEGDANYVGYAARLAELRKKSAQMPTPSDLYCGRLALARLATASPDSRAPKFMKNEAWARKSLAAALGSWTELRHDTILYTKQSYSVAQAAFATMGKGGPQVVPKPVHGYVEPCPKIYAAIRDATRSLRLKIDTLGFPPDRALTGNLTSLEDLLISLETISAKELKGQRTSDPEQDLIENFGSRLRTITAFPHFTDVSEDFQTKMDREIIIVADVHTDVNSGLALEEAVGSPLSICAYCTVDGRRTLCKGAVYSYYEFKQRVADRLTDEQWRKMLDEHKAPGLPAWTRVYIASP